MKNYTKKFNQVSDAAAKAKFRRIAGTNKSCQIGFSTWWIGKDIDGQKEIYGLSEHEDLSPDLEKQAPLAIFVSTNYHNETSIDKMYKSNGKKW